MDVFKEMRKKAGMLDDVVIVTKSNDYDAKGTVIIPRYEEMDNTIYLDNNYPVTMEAFDSIFINLKMKLSLPKGHVCVVGLNPRLELPLIMPSGVRVFASDEELSVKVMNLSPHETPIKLAEPLFTLTIVKQSEACLFQLTDFDE